MRWIKRAAASIRPKQAYIEWANSLEAGRVKLGPDFMPEGRIYLIEAMVEGLLDIPAVIEPYYQLI